MEKALQSAPDAVTRQGIEAILQRSRRIDVVNYTSEFLIGTTTTALRARAEFAWARSIPDELWVEYVLPPRIADEELDDWRGEFYLKMKPVVSQCRDTKSAVLAIHKWLWSDKKVKFAVDESRDRSPRQTMKIGIGRCFELNILFTALLRSACIPARLTGSSWWYTNDFYHYWVEYWDTEKREWSYIEGASENPDWFMARNGKIDISTVYALPGWAKERDPIGREAWEELTDVTARYVPVSEIRVSTSPNTQVTAYTWNLSAWRSVAGSRADANGQCVFKLGASARQFPYLFTAIAGDKMAWQPVRVLPNQNFDLKIMPGALTEPLMIPAATKPEKAQSE